MIRRKKARTWAASAVALGLLVMGISTSATATTSRVSSTYAPVKGISVFLHNSTSSITDAQLATKIDQVCAYVKSLNANSISLNFQFVMTSLTSNDPHAGSVTPSPARIELITRIARSYGLMVQLRPELDESNFGVNTWRGLIAPTDVPLWFANYTAFLKPYLEVARVAGASDFVVGVELSSMLPYKSQWLQLLQTARTIFGPHLQYSQSHNTFSELPGAEFGWDFYTAIPNSFMTSGTTVANLQNGMQAMLTNPTKDQQTTPFPFMTPLRSTTLGEVGIAAVANSWQYPVRVAYQIPNGTAVNRAAQADWFTAACNVMWSNHMAGMYYWALYLPEWTPGENDSADYLLWSGTASETAIKNCYARTS